MLRADDGGRKQFGLHAREKIAINGESLS